MLQLVLSLLLITFAAVAVLGYVVYTDRQRARRDLDRMRERVAEITART